MTTPSPWKVPLIVILFVLSIGETNAVTTRRISVGAEPLSIAVNSLTGLLYSANLDSTVSVADTSTDTVIASISLPSIPLGVAVNENTNLVYANTSNNGVYVIDGATNTIVANVATGAGGGQIDINPTMNRVYSVNEGSNNISVIDGATNTVIDTVAVSACPTVVAVNRDSGYIYVSYLLLSTITVIDGGTDTIIATITLASGSTRSLVVDRGLNRLYVSEFIDFEAFDATNFSLIVTRWYNQDRGPLAVDLKSHVIYETVNFFQRGTLFVINPHSLRVEASTVTSFGATSMAVDELTGNLYVGQGGFTGASYIFVYQMN